MKVAQPHPHPNLPPEGEGGSWCRVTGKSFSLPLRGRCAETWSRGPLAGCDREIGYERVVSGPMRVSGVRSPKGPLFRPTTRHPSTIRLEPAPSSAGAGWGWVIYNSVAVILVQTLNLDADVPRGAAARRCGVRTETSRVGGCARVQAVRTAGEEIMTTARNRWGASAKSGKGKVKRNAGIRIN
jgi:hypothetical protein